MFSKTGTGRIIPRFTVPPPRYRYRILYVGDNYALSAALRDQLTDLSCQVVRCPANIVWLARRFIGSIPYTMFLFDEVLVGMSGEELAHFTRGQRDAPILIVKESEDVEDLTDRVRDLISGL